MKKILLLLVFVMGSTVAFAQAGNWEDWQKTSCYSKISFRLKDAGTRGEQHIWKIQFKSDYSELISFNYNVTDELQQYNITTHRKTLNANEVSKEIEIFTKEDNIYILVDKVSLSPYPQDFIDCN